MPVPNTCWGCNRPREAGGLFLYKSKDMLALIQAGNISTQYAVGWFTLALINAGLAQGKGRSGFGWWLASLFFGPAATLFIVLLDPHKSQ